MVDDVLIGIDIGTSAVDACAFTLDGALVAAASSALRVEYPQPGWAEQSPLAWRGAAFEAVCGVVARLGARRDAVRAIGLSGQCPSFTLLDDAGTPLTAGIIYQDTRAVVEAARLAGLLGASRMRERTGLWPSHYYVAAKLLWLAEHRPELRWSRPWLAQPRDVVAFALTGVAATDATHAGCTGLYDLGADAWAGDWVEALDLSWVILPPIVPPTASIGGLTAHAAAEVDLPVGTPLIVGAADNFCGDLAMGAMAPGVMGDSTGTTTCLDLAVPRELATGAALAPNLGLYAHFAPDLFFADAGLNATGAVIRWAADLLAGGDLGRLERLAQSSAPTSDAPLLLPYLGGGDRSDAAAMGSWHGLALAHRPETLARSAYEGVTFALRELVDHFRAAGFAVSGARLGGGGSKSAYWNRLKADVWGLPVRASAHDDATALGAAMLAGIAVGMYRDLDDAVARAAQLGPSCEPNAAVAELYDERYARWLSLKS